MYRTTLWWIMVAVWLTSWLFLRNCSRMLILTRFVERTSAGHSVMQVIKVASKDPISREMKKMTCHVISLVYQVHLAPVQDYMIPIGCYQNQQKTSIYIYIYLCQLRGVCYLIAQTTVTTTPCPVQSVPISCQQYLITGVEFKVNTLPETNIAIKDNCLKICK